MKKQKPIDEKAVRGHKSVGADDQGGQDRITPGQRVAPDSMKPLFPNLKNHHKNVREG